MEEKIRVFLSAEENIEKLNAAETLEEVVNIFEKNEIQISAEEAVVIVRAIWESNENDELSESDLEAVAGGAGVSAWEIFKTAYGIVKDYGKKLYNLGYNGARKGWW